VAFHWYKLVQYIFWVYGFQIISLGWGNFNELICLLLSDQFKVLSIKQWEFFHRLYNLATIKQTNWTISLIVPVSCRYNKLITRLYFAWFCCIWCSYVLKEFSMKCAAWHFCSCMKNTWKTSTVMTPSIWSSIFLFFVIRMLGHNHYFLVFFNQGPSCS